MSTTMTMRPLTVLAAALALGGCAGGSAMSGGFDLSHPYNRPDSVRTVLARVASARAEETPAMVVLTSAPPARGFAVFSLPDGRRLWQSGATIDARPTVAGTTVVSHTAGTVIGWDATSGRERWRQSDRGHALIGAGGDADLLAVTLGPGGISHRRGVILGLDPTRGTVRFERSVEQSLGVPTAAGGYLFVPWSGQYLSVIDAASGDEHARLRNLHDVIGRATRERDGIYFGSRAIYRFAPESARNDREGTGAYAIPRRDLPGDPSLLRDGYRPAVAGLDARERVTIRMRFDPAEQGVKPVDGAVYALFHRVVFALDARDGGVRWAYSHDHDIAGAEAVRGGFVLVDDRGEAAMIDARGGNVRWRQSLGAPAAQAVFSLPIDFAPEANVNDPAASLADTLTAVAGSTDDRMLPARLFAVRTLANVPGADATRGLIDVTSRRNYPAPLRQAAGEALARRTDGGDAMVEALGSRHDYLRGTTTPPVGFLARGLAHSNERRGVAPLLRHLQDPSTPATDLPHVVGALKTLGDTAAVPALLDLLRLYHADDGLVPPVGEGDPINDRSLPEQQALNSAMDLAAQTIAAIGSPADRRWLRSLADDPNTVEPVRVALGRVAPAAEGATTTDASASAASTSDGTEPEGPPVADRNLPATRVTGEMIRDAMSSAREDMMRCLNGLSSRPAQVRITFRYDGEGAISEVSVVPANLAPCLVPLVRTVRLPASQTVREIGTYYLVGGML